MLCCRFVTARLLVAHRSEHHMGRGLEEPVCPSCGKQFVSQNGLSDHMKVNGPYHRRGRCGWCRKQFKSWSEHQAHLDQHHSGIQKHVCGHCDVSVFDTVEKMTDHRMFCRVIAASAQVNEMCLLPWRKVIMHNILKKRSTRLVKEKWHALSAETR